MKSLAAALLSLCFVTTVFAQAARDASPPGKPTWRAAPPDLWAMVIDRTCQMGFATLRMRRFATFGQPLPVAMVQPTTCARTSGNDPQLARDLHRDLPGAGEQPVRSSITVERRDSRWQGTSFGPEAGRHDEARAAWLVRPAWRPSYVLVHVAALNRHYLGHRAGNRLILTTIVDDPVLKLPAGRDIPAADAFAALAPIAQRHNGLPS
jgi:hypothetical protein